MKSSLDWDAFKKQQGIEEELAQHKKDGFASFSMTKRRSVSGIVVERMMIIKLMLCVADFSPRRTFWTRLSGSSMSWSSPSDPRRPAKRVLLLPCVVHSRAILLWTHNTRKPQLVAVEGP